MIVTGPSHAGASIKPIAYSDDGVILCQTSFYKNDMGAHAFIPVEYGYLLVSSNGMWEEIAYHTSDSYEDTIANNFYKRLDFRNPPQHLDSILLAHHIENYVDDLGKNRYFWTPKAIYDGYDKVISYQVKQKTLYGYTNKTGEGTRTPSAYALKGVVFFENETHFSEDYEDILQIGATFFETEFTFPIDLYSVTGILFIKK